MSSSVIRHARPGDIPALIALASETFLDSFGDYHTPENCTAFIAASHNAEVYNAAIENETTCLLVAEEAGVLVAYLYSKPTSLPVEENLAAAHELSKIYTRSSHQSRGLGAKIIKVWEAWAAQHGLNDLVLGVWSENKAAQVFYMRHGYTKISSYKLQVGEALDTDHIYHKRL